jgi:hypothetical protein
MARCQVTSEKSSKNCISLFGGKPATGLPTPPPHLSASRYRTFYTCWMEKCEWDVRDLLAGITRGGGGRVGWFAKWCHSLTDNQINCKLKTKIAKTILLLRYLDKICLILTGGFWQVKKEVGHSNTRGTVRLCSIPAEILLHIVYIFNILCGLKVISSRQLQ